MNDIKENLEEFTEELTEDVEELVEKLKQERDELGVKLHLAKMCATSNGVANSNRSSIAVFKHH